MKPRWVSLRSPTMITTLSFLIVGTIGVTVWSVSGPRGGGTPASSVASNTLSEAAVPTASEESPGTQASSSGIDDSRLAYFGVPLEGSVVAFVVDSDATMTPYIDQIAYVTDAVTRGLEPGATRFGIRVATDQNEQVVFHLAESSEAAWARAQSTLTGFLPGGRTNLSRALSEVAGWYPDQVFLVVSKRIEPEMVRVLAQKAEQTGAVIHVIALGEAAEQDLSAIAQSTGGAAVSVTSGRLAEAVRQVELAEAAAG